MTKEELLELLDKDKDLDHYNNGILLAFRGLKTILYDSFSQGHDDWDLIICEDDCHIY